MRRAIRRSFFAILTASSAMLSQAASAQDVTLRNGDGTIDISGSLIDFDGEYYRVDSRFGPVTVSADGLRCLGSGCPDPGALTTEARFVGASWIANRLFPLLLEAFARQRDFDLVRRIIDTRETDYRMLRSDGTLAGRFQVRSSTTEDGFLALFNGDATVALAVREPLEIEELAASASEAEAEAILRRRARIIALDAMVAVTSPANPTDGLSPEELAAIFTGQITSWATFGLPDAPIRLHLPSNNNGLVQSFVHDLVLPTRRDLAANVTRHTDLADLSDAVLSDPMAIGITSLSAAGSARVLSLRGACDRSIEATATSLSTGDYPFTSPLYAYTPPRRLPLLVREFIAFFETPEAERVVRQAGFVSQRITETPVEQQGRRLSQAIAAVGNDVTFEQVQTLSERMSAAARLSTTIRFEDGSSSFATQSRASISRLVRAIEAGAFEGRRLIFVGFSDGAGNAAANLRLSRSRADAARQAVQEAAAGANLSRLEMEIVGFGEALPMACDDSAWGRAVNRRVELWLE